MSRGYDIYKKLKYDYFAWIGNEPTRAGALERLQSLNRDDSGDATYVAIARTLPSLLAISPAASRSCKSR